MVRAEVADGVDAVRQAVRDQVRAGVDQIKIMASGGVMSPADEIDAVQYSPEELKAIVDEAARAHKYVMAHAYSGRAIVQAIKAGVRSIEHGNLLDEEGARAMKTAGAFLVPTMVTYEELWKSAKKIGLSDLQVKKLEAARQRSVDSLKLAKKIGVKIALGSDLLGSMRSAQAVELELQGQVQTPMEVLISATKTNAELLRLEDKIGTVEPGKIADLIVVRGDPLKDLRLFQNPDSIVVVMKEGVAYKNQLRAK
jgi:imidazolonepropionase-like amidohydrolase